jgi:hypothetical protein
METVLATGTDVVPLEKKRRIDFRLVLRAAVPLAIAATIASLPVPNGLAHYAW